ncbi:MAG: 16S rRNA (guanine(966)-N(2))-methyltransferase RsmD [Coriobacteriales bacterium]|nr:16S rRNA (guanine(966)-N(2))-methyltransferase RsmD [Coriobacteriales bacterium]
MRIVGGMWRGQAIEAPVGRDTRPTTDRMRETIASMVLSARGLNMEGESVLDAFAGSGGMGLELLSRGASWCTFCEKDRRASAVIKKNCSSLHVPTSAFAIVGGDVFKAVERRSLAGAPFGVVFLDPPYAMEVTRVAELVSGLEQEGLLAPDALVVYERSSGAGQLVVEGFEAIRTKKHGGTSIDLLRRSKQRGVSPLLGLS